MVLCYYVIKTENIHSTYVPVGKSYGSKKHKAGHPFINNARTSVDSKVKIENTNGKLDCKSRYPKCIKSNKLIKSRPTY